MKKFEFRNKIWEKISNDVKELIKLMICDPDKRLNAEQVLNHRWVKNLAPDALDAVLELNIESLKAYKNSNKLKKAVLTFIASRLKEEEVIHLKEIFNSLDVNKDGTLTLEEIKSGIGKLKDKSLDVQELFKSIDTDKSGVINYTEFLASTIENKVYLKEDKMFEAFRAFDKDGSGKISKQEIKQILRIQVEDESLIDDMIKKFDTDNDGEIDYNEFLKMMEK